MVAITANVGRPLLGRDSFQEVDIAGIVMPVTKYSFIVKNIEDLADTLRRAFYIAKSGRPGPVLVDVPKDITGMKYEYEPCHPAMVNREIKSIRKEDIDQALEMIREAKKPFIFVGGGSLLLRKQIEKSGKVGTAIFVEEIGANAAGYGLLYAATKTSR